MFLNIGCVKQPFVVFNIMFNNQSPLPKIKDMERSPLANPSPGKGKFVYLVLLKLNKKNIKTTLYKN